MKKQKMVQDIQLQRNESLAPQLQILSQSWNILNMFTLFIYFVYVLFNKILIILKILK
jgi:hypothetical protein